MSTTLREEMREREIVMSYGTAASTSVLDDVVRLLAETMNSRFLSARLGEEKRRRRITELQGLGREIWEGVDAREYINELRDEWDPR